jgi:hypothetical protein
MVRTVDGKFYLVEEPTEPGDREAVMPYSHSDVFDWHGLEPWQIERTVISGV